MVRSLRAAAVPAAVAVLIALSGLVLGRIYSDALLAQLVAGAAAGSVLVGVATRRLPSWLPGPVSVVLLAGYAALALSLAARHAELTAALPQLAGDAARNGIPRLLTAMIPVQPAPDTVLVPVVAAWLAGLAGTELAVRAGRVLLGCGVPAALYGAALYVVGPNADRAGWPTVAFVGTVAAALAVSAGRDTGAGAVPPAARRRLRLRGAAGAVLGLAAIVAVTAAGGPWLGARVSTTPVDPRSYVQPPQVDSLDESPLNRISGWALAPTQRLFDVAVAGPPPPGSAAARQRIRLAVLPDYDGVTWRVGATYRNAGRVLPAAPLPPAARVRRVRQEITVAELTGRLLPALPTPAGVDGARVAYDPGSGTLMRPEGLAAGVRYAVTSVVAEPDYNTLPSATVPAGDAAKRYLELNAEAGEQLRRLADQLARGNGAPFDRASAVETFLREHYRLAADAPSGHALPNLGFFLFGPRDGGGQQGTSEQFAAAFAVLGRLMGLPTRVVVGFRTGAAGGPVTAADALAWPEVLFDELGWVPFDPLPRPSQETRPVEEALVPAPEKSPPAESPPPAVTPTPSAAAVAAPPQRRGASPALITVGVAGFMLLTVGAVAAALLQARRAQRRRRLGATAPAERIRGAWFDLADALRLAGRPAPAYLSASEVARHAATVAAAEPGRQRRPKHHLAYSPGPGGDAGAYPLDALVEGVNRIAFAPTAVAEEHARLAVAQAVTWADAVRDGQARWRRLWWRVHPGPLRWHRR